MDNKERIITELKESIGRAEDNYYRAMCASRGVDASKEWGNSGQSLASIVSGYRQELDEAKQALKYAEDNL